mgnify:CR=1 FL=1
MGEVGDKARGTMKELKGKVTGNKTEMGKGEALKIRGSAKSKAKDLKRNLKEAAYGDEERGPTVDRETMAPATKRQR